MSRSRRKTPIFGHTNSRSERKDKQLWHQRWRAHERTVLVGASPDVLEAHQTIREQQVSNPWTMDKDAHSWWSKERRVALAPQLAHEKGRSDQERATLQTRLLRKWMGK